MTVTAKDVGRRMVALASVGLDYYTYAEVREMTDAEVSAIIEARHKVKGRVRLVLHKIGNVLGVGA